MPDGIAGHHRITPACAGKRKKGRRRCCENTEHPRVCTPLGCFFNCRITPACAGKITVAIAQAAAFWDHPRVCGEKKKAVFSCLCFVGSPPRVRGKA